MATSTVLAASVRALGAEFNPTILEATRAIYRPYLDLTPAPKETLDVSYGLHPRHRLDLYQPAGTSEAVLVFVHGGGFVGGDKSSDGAFYLNVGRWLARQGITAVLPNYRLAPANAWPAGAQDVSAVLRWVKENKPLLGGADTPVIVLGQSAGACHVASWLFDDHARGGARQDVASVMLMSGFYKAVAPLPAGARAYFGEDGAQYKARSPLTHARQVSVPLWLSVAELDPPWLASQTYGLAQALTEAGGRSPDFHLFHGHNHVSTVQSIGSGQQDVGQEILRVVRSLS